MTGLIVELKTYKYKHVYIKTMYITWINPFMKRQHFGLDLPKWKPLSLVPIYISCTPNLFYRCDGPLARQSRHLLGLYKLLWESLVYKFKGKVARLLCTMPQGLVLDEIFSYLLEQ